MAGASNNLVACPEHQPLTRGAQHSLHFAQEPKHTPHPVAPHPGPCAARAARTFCDRRASRAVRAPIHGKTHVPRGPTERRASHAGRAPLRHTSSFLLPNLLQAWVHAERCRCRSCDANLSYTERGAVGERRAARVGRTSPSVAAAAERLSTGSFGQKMADTQAHIRWDPCPSRCCAPHLRRPHGQDMQALPNGITQTYMR